MHSVTATGADSEVGAATSHDRRASVRYLTTPDAFSYSLGKATDVCLVAKVQDISCRGIGLLLDERVEVGTILSIELHSKSQSLPCFMLARVLWTGPRSDGTTIAGCQFSRSLSEQELHALL